MKINIQTRKKVVIIMIIITSIAVFFSSLANCYWPLLISILINYLYFREFWPRISITSAQRMIGKNKVLTTTKRINCSIHSLRVLLEKNRELSSRRQTFRWFLSNSQINGIKKIKIRKDCYFLIKPYSPEKISDNPIANRLRRIETVEPQIIEEIIKEQVEWESENQESRTDIQLKSAEMMN